MRTPKSHLPLPPLHRDSYLEQAQTIVATTVKVNRDPLQRLVALSTLVNDHQRLADLGRRRRDELALSLAFHEDLTGLHATIGVNRTRFYQMRCDALRLTDSERAGKWLLGPDGETLEQRRDRVSERALACGIRRQRSAYYQLPVAAERVFLHDTIAALARAERDRIVTELIGQGWSRPRIAQLIGRNPSRISQMKRRTAA